MKKVVFLAAFTAILFSGCSDKCNGGESWCKNDHERMYCNEELSDDWRTQDCDSMFEDPGEGTACATFNGTSKCARICVFGQPATCDDAYTLVSCLKKTYKDGSESGVLWYEHCMNGCAVDNNGIASCQENPSN